ncbi:MAG: DNA translocase FtsK [Candidatus Omnitrophota bacterium]|nr:DNA translocase FtsK [Candidatus Omnitrophota bacterium]
MARAKRKFLSLTPQRLNELWGVLLLAGSLFLFMALISYRPDDLPFFTSHPSSEIRNLCGPIGAWISGITREGLGWVAFVLPALAAVWSVSFFNGAPPQKPALRLMGAALLCAAGSSLLTLLWTQTPEARWQRGGVVGVLVGDQATQYFGWWGAVVVLITIGLLCLIVSTELAVWPVLRGGAEAAGEWGRQMAGWITSRKTTVVHRKSKTSPAPVLKVTPELPKKEKELEFEEPAPAPKIKLPPKMAAAPAPPPPKPASRPVSSEPALESAGVKLPYQLPSLDLLNVAAPAVAGQSREQLEANAKVLEETLRDFGLEVRVAEVEMGPVITRYEIEPAPGVKIQKITTLSDDLALALKSTSVRIIAPIPGKARVGIEVPNQSSSLVTLREVLQSKEFQQVHSKLTIALGKDSAGHPLLADLAGMPHLLIAGATGSGKTVCMNGLIVSLLFNATPEEVRFLMVDPKMVELAPFNGLPHLLMPVLTSAKKVPAALGWVIEEMETRYRLFAKLGLRNIQAYHQKFSQNQLPKEEIPDHLPYIVVIIDELADLMLVAQAEIEKSIARLAHLSRAVGIHMVLATQRPSVDVLTGVIKANFPARISFQVASRVDSRTVLDAIGAEKLLGKGDLLYMQPGASKLTRGQGTLVTDAEIERVVQFIKGQRPTHYEIAEIADTEGSEGRSGSGGPVTTRDALYDEAVRVIVEAGQASVSLLQRRMRLGYGRAARILDMMEEEGIVGPIRGAKPREVYLKEVPTHEPIGRRATEIGT